ncbi:DUF4279 domain-containing protein [Flavobacterium sp. DG1-102-2]|uniref:DUF4279 domain-containing protein n=1 Tax=Flavobacterium sp. DG1-102-2 TaxID=3081663 RepID=UPI00294A4C93|nr:DUF4279 domain-containing protein [Flavobacterium sp. DG1-102-2]MDV6168686.1 DUF4279 domain-containing protein [Flavobacterium sp. DG1-102-2]
MTDTTGYVYFAIKTEEDNFNIERFNNYLTIQPTRFQEKFEKGNVPVCTIWEYGTDKLVNPFYFEEIRRLTDMLEKHKPEFLRLKKEYPSVTYVLEVVICLGDETPGLHFSKHTIKFINDVGGTIDCDIYNSK